MDMAERFGIDGGRCGARFAGSRVSFGAGLQGVRPGLWADAGSRPEGIVGRARVGPGLKKEASDEA